MANALFDKRKLLGKAPFKSTRKENFGRTSIKVVQYIFQKDASRFHAKLKAMRQLIIS